MSADTEKKIKNIFAYLTPSILSNIMPIVTIPILTRFLMPKDFGIVALAMTFPALIVGVLSLNVQEGAERYFFEYRKNIKDLSNLINTTVIFLLFIFTISIPLIFIMKDFLSVKIMGTSDCGSAVFVSYVTACFGTIVGFYFVMYRNMEEGKKYSFFTIIQMITNTVLTLFLVVYFRLGYMGVIYGTFGAVFLTFCLLFRSFQQKFPFSFNSKMLIDNIKYGVPLLPTHFVGNINNFIDKYLLRSIVSLSITGIYSIAQNVSRKLFVFVTAIQSTFYPLFMKDMFDKGQGEGGVSVGRNFTVYTYISLSAVLIMILFGEEFVYILAPSSYHNAINVMLVLLCGVATQAFGKIAGLPLIYVKKVYLIFPITVLGLVINVFLNLLLIPKWDAIGAGIGLTVTTIVYNGIILVISRRYYKIVYEKRILFFLYLNIFISAALLIYFRIEGFSFLLKYSVKIISLIVFIALGIKTNILTKRNIQIIFNIFKLKSAPANAV